MQKIAIFCKNHTILAKNGPLKPHKIAKNTNIKILLNYKVSKCPKEHLYQKLGHLEQMCKIPIKFCLKIGHFFRAEHPLCFI